MTATTATFGQWAILELLGHVRLGGYVTEEQRFGAALGRIDIPMADGSQTTQYFGGGSIYRLTPTTEEIARAVALNSQVAPIQRWEAARLGLLSQTVTVDSDDDNDDDDYGD